MRPATPEPILIAGVGNVLKGDDGFGIEAAKRIMHRHDLPAGIDIIETGIGGMSLVQEAMRGYAALVLLDAYRKGGRPGALYLLEPKLPDLGHDLHARRDFFADTHYATPLRALHLLQATGKLPDTVRIIGCEPATSEEYHLGLSAPVAAAIDPAVGMLFDWIEHYRLATASP